MLQGIWLNFLDNIRIICYFILLFDTHSERVYYVNK